MGKSTAKKKMGAQQNGGFNGSGRHKEDNKNEPEKGGFVFWSPQEGWGQIK